MATLKISELSVGDWVRYEDRICQIAEISHLTYTFGCKEMRSVPSVTLYYEDDMPTYQESVPLKDIHPIPITAEILEKNGWSTDGMYATLRLTENSHLEYYYHEHRLRKYYCGVDEWQNHAKVTDITFAAHCYSVHQLQHALRLAGVDKEINL